MTEYLVVWKIDIDADSPLEAAKEARKIQLDKDSMATVFEVSDKKTLNRVTSVDLTGE